MQNSILVVGDSWASAREGDTKLDAGWPKYMGIASSNRQGVNGSTAADWACNKGETLSKAAGTVADVVIISLLGNDAQVALRDGVISPIELATALKNMRKVVSALSATRKQTIVILYTDPFFGKHPIASTVAPLLNDVIRLACYGLPVTFADTSQWLLPEHFIIPDIHPTQAGHKVLGEKILELIESCS